MTDIIEQLYAWLADEERSAEVGAADSHRDPRHALRQVDVLRRIVQLHTPNDGRCPACGCIATAEYLCDTLHILTELWADRSDAEDTPMTARGIAAPVDADAVTDVGGTATVASTTVDWQAVWGSVTNLLLHRQELSQQHIAFLRLASLQAILDGVSVLRVPDAYAHHVIETRLRHHLEDALAEVLGTPTLVAVTVRPPGDATSPAAVDTTPSSTRHRSHGLKPEYTFETFLGGVSNRFAHAAAYAVSEAPATAYNPLFIYGGPASDRRHLLHAIGHSALALGTVRSVLHVSAADFARDFITSVCDGTVSEFRRRYRDEVDMLLIDDIQFLENRERTQEEFFQTFNTLHNANKQIVIAADRKAKDLARLEDRLRTRFEWGLVTDLKPPDLETRIAILQKVQAQHGLHVPKEVLEFIASRIIGSVHELEGALLRVTAFASLNRSTVDLGLAEEVLRDANADGPAPELTVEQIMDVVAEYFGVSADDLRGQSRSRLLINARQVAMYLCRELTDMSLPYIGQAFGGRDHTTVMHAERKIRQLMSERRTLYNQIAELTNRIKQPTKH